MDSKRWHRAQELFHEALSRDGVERARFLDDACADDEQLREIVDRLLQADTDAPTIFDLGGEDLASLVGSDFEGPPARLGRYEVLEQIGRGGMGTVYLARRADGRFERDVALKVVRAGLGSEEPLRRFKAEGRILARLEHPHIARLYDAGVDDGQPFLVMEYVRGEAIDRHCDRHALGIVARLRLFIRVCEAVQYAHQQLVIHRDLKPSNILITDQGDVKLLDFGISKLIVDDDSAGVADTRTGTRVMTVEYASPEQVRGEPVTTASDVYSLGVVLYELLTGHRPYDGGSNALDSALAVVEQAPARPSSAVTRSDTIAVTAAVDAPTPVDVARLRDSTPDRLRRRLRGDLDTILLKALQKEPERRYGSVQLMLDDIGHHLEGRPVLARPDSTVYRLRKFARRNWLGVAATGAVGLALVAGLSAALWQANVAAAERDSARLEAEKANRVTDFLIGVFEVADPAEARADTLTAAQILDRGAARIAVGLENEPIIQATMMDVIGRVYSSLSLYDKADSLLNRSLERRLELLGATHPDVATSTHHLASLAFLRSDPRADSLYRVAIDLRRSALGPDDPLVAESLTGLAFATLGRDNATAEAAIDEAMRIYTNAPGDFEIDIANVTYARGFIMHDRGEYAEAERLYRTALAVQQNRLGPQHPATLTTTSNLGFLLQLVGRYQAADSSLQAVLAARRQVFGPRHARVANSLNALAELRYVQGDYDAAESFIRDALDIRMEVYGEENAITLNTNFYLARLLQARGEFGAADSLFRQVLATAESRGLAGNSLARVVNGFAGVLETRGDFAGAEAFYRRAWEIYRAALGDGHPFTAIVEGNVAAMLLDQGNLDEAEPMFRSALATLRTAWGDDHQSVGVVRLHLGTLLMLRGSLEDAESTMREALRVIEAALPPDHWRVGQARMRLGACLADLSRFTEAEELLLSSYPILEANQRPRFGDWRQLLSELFELYTAQGRPEQAARYRTLFQASMAARPAG